MISITAPKMASAAVPATYRPNHSAPPVDPTGSTSLVALGRAVAATVTVVTWLLPGDVTAPGVSAATEKAMRSVAIGCSSSSRSSQVIVHAPFGKGLSTSTLKVRSSSASCGMPVFCG